MLFDIEKIRTYCLSGLLAVLCIGMINVGFSQNLNGGSTSNSDRIEKGEEYRTSDVGHSLRLTNVSVKKALEIISQKANLVLSYRSDLLERAGDVSLNAQKIEIDEAIKKALSNTELDYKIMDSGHLVVFAKEKVGSITGEVIDAESHKPLKDAKVNLLNNKSGKAIDIEKGTFVDSTGKFDIHNVEAGTYKVVVNFDGYKKVSEWVEIRNKETTQRNFQLQLEN